jgi:EAL domain-containing protein (putative c-di-GMP-specific phosphodiesterase class I)
MVSSIHQLGRAMNIETVAEFVETDAILKKLADIGIDYAQGYGIARPGPLSGLQAVVRQSA